MITNKPINYTGYRKDFQNFQVQQQQDLAPAVVQQQYQREDSDYLRRLQQNDASVIPQKYSQIMKSQRMIRDMMPEQPKFIRDNMAINDINGDKRQSVYKTVARDILSTKDIDGSHPKNQQFLNKNYDTLDYTDVSKRRQTNFGQRNPLDPVYFLINQDGQKVSYGQIEGKPTSVIMNKFEQASQNLDQGSSYKQRFNVYGKEIAPRDALKTDDIEGAQPKQNRNLTFKHSTRQSDPLNPNYIYPGFNDVQQYIEQQQQLKNNNELRKNQSMQNLNSKDMMQNQNQLDNQTFHGKLTRNESMPNINNNHNYSRTQLFQGENNRVLL
ncbi:UNKNOWN [Stylonychia lemnae]|uniref:Uncharacterized protein n=1 Tax=Stylonychia lemnae TaxID=5949 RepID=A0A078A294_STYLE|nr:UNKNOWN [Stylonychia lemnae]|eukprot:CDW76260.1 UNKNOWN [Stylonychia lemnae]